ncbi:MAG: LptE family protein [bacterium]
MTTEQISAHNIKTIKKINLHCMLLYCCCATALFIACGPYSFSGSAFPHLKTIAIPLFQDNTAEFGVKEQLTNELIQAFSQENSLKIADRRSADSILNGTIVAITDQAGSYTREEKVNEIQVHLLIEIKYEDLVKRKIVWEDKISQFGSYTPGTGEKSSREDAITEAIAKISEEVLNRTVSGW